MFRTAFAGALLCLLLTVSADARSRTVVAHPDCNVLWPCAGVSASPRGERIARAVGFGAAQKVYKPLGERTSGLVPELQAKLASIQSACPGTVAISGVRHTYIAGTRRISLHASGRAVDVRGNPACVYRELQGWPGGFSTDYGRVRHVHISIGGREDGLRFAHGGHRHARHRTGHRYASAGR